MNSLRSSVFFRTLLCDTTAEFQALNSTELPDGATAFNRQDETLWRLDKNAGDDFDDLETNVLQKPNDQTNGRWFAELVNGGSPYQFSGYLAAPVAVTMTGNQWNKLGSTTGIFEGTSGTGSGLFTQDPDTGEITYNGPPRSMLASVRACINNGIGSTSIAMHAAIALDGDVADGGTTNYPELGEQAENIINTLSQIVVERVVQLTPGAKLQLLFRNATNADDIVVTYYQINHSPL